ncbi:SAM-dependent methyltransferase [Micromonospora sp. NPDC048999]|uniref:SAM-dependent methyltransferase n=1 Tax=Micromonospora sp. NPDC048999 TaxID=3155391 RepID=UPI0033DCA8BE
MSSEESTLAAGAEALSRIDTSVAHPARRYNYWLGGKDNFQADRESGDAIAAVFPSVRIAVLENRAFLRRAVAYLAREAGIRQFLDIGTGIPTADNTHEVAQAIAPESRIVYVDNDPIVLSHARALLTSTPHGATAYIDADLREPERILSHPDLLETLDLSQPVALMLLAVMHFIEDEDDPYGIVNRLLDALPSGSYLTITHGTVDFMPEEQRQQGHAVATNGRHGALKPRTREEYGRFFDGLQLVPPGIAVVTEWRAEGESGERPAPADAAIFGAVARKP